MRSRGNLTVVQPPGFVVPQLMVVPLTKGRQYMFQCSSIRPSPEILTLAMRRLRRIIPVLFTGSSRRDRMPQYLHMISIRRGQPHIHPELPVPAPEDQASHMAPWAENVGGVPGRW